MINQSKITGLILAGGAGRRVGGKDKGLLEFSEKSLIAHQLEWLSPQVETILISANRNIQYYQQFGFPVIQDSSSDYAGPLQGIRRAIGICKTTHLFVHPIDVPLLPTNLIERMLERVSTGYHLANNEIHGKRQSYYLKSSEREHYLSMLLPVDLGNDLQSFLQSGYKRVRDFHKNINSLAIDLEIPEKNFQNFNHIQDYQ